MKVAGVPLAAGSDAPVIPMNPLVGIYSAATRKSESAGLVLPGEAMGVEDALRMYTLGSAYASFEERVSGSLEEGKRADLALLDRDVTRAEPDGLLSCKAVLTMVGGEVVWEG